MSRSFLAIKIFISIAAVSATAELGHAQRPFSRVLMSEGSDEEGEVDEIETDRDSFTPSTKVVGRGRFVFESAYSFIDNRGVPETHSFPEIVGRYGISDDIELRLGWNYEVGGAGSPVSGNIPDRLEETAELERASRLLYGAKLFLTEQCDWLPKSSFILQGFTPTSGEVNDSSLSATYVFGWESGNAWVWDSAIRYSTSGFEEDDFNVWSPSTVIKIPIGERLKGHVEYFGIFTDGRVEESTQHFFSPGVHYLVTPNFEIGTRVGWGINDQAPNFFTNFGVGIRY